jgi:hypothetical protein
MTEVRRFPAPWHADKISGGYVVRDANGHALAYVYARATMAEATQAKTLTTDEARRIAANIVRLPGLLRSGQIQQR